MQKTISEKQITQCLTCRIGYKTICNFKDIYEIIKAENKIDSCKQLIKKTKKQTKDYQKLKKELDELNYCYKSLLQKYKGSIDDLVECLNLKDCTFEEETLTEERSLDALKTLCTFKDFDDINIEDNFCLFNLQRIIAPIRHLYNDNSLNEDIVDQIPGKISVLRCMSRVNKMNICSYDTEDDQNILSYFSAKNSSDILTKTIAKCIRNIFSFYVKNNKPKIETRSQCFQQLLSTLKMKEQIEHPMSELRKVTYFDRVKKLRTEYQSIIYEYLIYAPKHLGSNLTRIMQIQNMSEQDIAKLTNLKANNIQSLMKSQTTKLKEKEIDLICRALLISNSLLFTGTGEIYGNWKEVLILKDQKLEKVNEKLKQTFENKRQVTDFIRSNIQELINVSKEEFKETLEQNPEFFEKEPLCLYESEIEEYDNLLHPEEANTLLKVLEKFNSI